MSATSINRKVLSHLKKYLAHDSQYIDCLIVSVFLKQHNIIVVNNKLIREFCLPKNNVDVLDFYEYLSESRIILQLEDLVEIYEFIISPEDKEVNGAVYTPLYIRSFIIDEILNAILDIDLLHKKFGDIACGCGGFFLTLSNNIHNRLNITYAEIYRNNIFGIDIQDYSIRRCQILLSLNAIINGEDIDKFTFNLYVGNSLDFNWSVNDAIRMNGGFDVIIGNPPYVSASKMDRESKALVKLWSVSSTGKTDMYIPFFQIAIENIVENGLLGFITVNNFYRSVNGRALRKYFSSHGYYIKLIDFESEQVFSGRSTYTCICFVAKSKTHYIDFVRTRSENLKRITPLHYSRIFYANINDDSQWILNTQETIELIHKIENTGTPLGKLYEIRNGFATLRNDVYTFVPNSSDETFYYFCKDNKTYQIEKGICRDAIKPNIIKKPSDITKFTEKLIYPYIKTPEGVQLLPEESLKLLYPCAYQYLYHQKDKLKRRDNGEKSYESWYAYGRTQALDIEGYKLFFPYLSNHPYFVLSNNKNLMFYNGYAIIHDSIDELKFIQKILSTPFFWQYIIETSKPYGGDYYALAKNYVKRFGVYKFSQTEKQRIIAMNVNDVNKLLYDIYCIDNNG